MDLKRKGIFEETTSSEVAYWEPYARIIAESVHIRGVQKLSQAELALQMGTKQSVISRFENMGRLPSYDFFVRLSQALGYSPGMTLFGDFMAILPLNKQQEIRAIAERTGVSTQTYVQAIFEEAIEQDLYVKNNRNPNPIVDIKEWMDIVSRVGRSSGTAANDTFINPEPDSSKTQQLAKCG
jgi:transcriptional regulator with XRE-family HTH domain